MKHHIRMDLLYLLIQLCQCDVNNRCVTLNIQGLDMLLLNKAFFTQKNSSFAQCAKLCWRYSLCASISYIRTDLECRLNFVNKTSAPEEYVHDTNGIYMASDDIAESGLIDVPRGNCSTAQRHFLISGGNHVCVRFGFSNIKNGAKGKPTQQSSLYVTSVSSKAVDNVWSSSYHVGCAVTLSESTPWWHVDLETAFLILQIRILNRGDCCGDRLRNLVVYYGMSLDSLTEYGTFAGPGVDGELVTIKKDVYVVGRYVKIVMYYENHLQICEVGVDVADL